VPSLNTPAARSLVSLQHLGLVRTFSRVSTVVVVAPPFWIMTSAFDSEMKSKRRP
jgi:hypothetical protein